MNSFLCSLWWFSEFLYIGLQRADWLSTVHLMNPWCRALELWDTFSKFNSFLRPLTHYTVLQGRHEESCPTYYACPLDVYLKTPYLSGHWNNIESFTKLCLLRLIMVQEKSMLLTPGGYYQYNPNHQYELYWRLLTPLGLLEGKMKIYLHLLKFEDILDIFYAIHDYRYSWHFDFALQPHSE